LLCRKKNQAAANCSSPAQKENPRRKLRIQKAGMKTFAAKRITPPQIAKSCRKLRRAAAIWKLLPQFENCRRKWETLAAIRKPSPQMEYRRRKKEINAEICGVISQKGAQVHKILQ